MPAFYLCDNDREPDGIKSSTDGRGFIFIHKRARPEGRTKPSVGPYDPSSDRAGRAAGPRT